MAYSSDNPSPRHEQLIHQYKLMHTQGFFAGIGCYKHRKALRKLICETGAKTALDYGCGAGDQFVKGRNPTALFAKLNVFCDSWQEALGIESIEGYDPGSANHCNRPSTRFDLVYAIDVLEHIDADDLPWTINDIFSYATKAVYMTVATVPAKKNLFNGENAHVTIREPDWWMVLFEEASRQHPGLRYQVIFEDGSEKK